MVDYSSVDFDVIGKHVDHIIMEIIEVQWNKYWIDNANGRMPHVTPRHL